eukprot:4444273-Prymnesium_polylepis.1
MSSDPAESRLVGRVVRRSLRRALRTERQAARCPLGPGHDPQPGSRLLSAPSTSADRDSATAAVLSTTTRLRRLADR